MIKLFLSILLFNIYFTSPLFASDTLYPNRIVCEYKSWFEFKPNKLIAFEFINNVYVDFYSETKDVELDIKTYTYSTTSNHINLYHPNNDGLIWFSINRKNLHLIRLGENQNKAKCRLANDEYLLDIFEDVFPSNNSKNIL